MKMFDFSDLKTKTFQYRGQYYRIFHSIQQGIGWFVEQYPTLWNYSRPWGGAAKRLGPSFEDPNELIRTIKIDNQTLEKIILSLPEPDPSQWPIYDYNYELFLIDISHVKLQL